MKRYPQPTSVQDAVLMAERLASFLERLDVPLSQARALDLVARISGLPNWDRMRAGLVRLEGAQVPFADHALTLILRLDAPDPEMTLRAIEAVWKSHLTDHERSDPGLAGARSWLRAAVPAAHAWARAHRSPLTPDQLCAALEAGTGQAFLRARCRPSTILPNLLDLHAWSVLDRIDAPWAAGLDTCMRSVPGYDTDRTLTGTPQSDRFRRSAELRMRLTMAPLRDLVDEVRIEPAST